MGDVNKQRHFLCKYAVKRMKQCKITGSGSRRLHSILLTLPRKNDSSVVPVKIHKTFFLDFLEITAKTVITCHDKQTNLGTCKEDRRGKHQNRPNKTTADQEKLVRQHI